MGREWVHMCESTLGAKGDIEEVDFIFHKKMLRTEKSRSRNKSTLFSDMKATIKRISYDISKGLCLERGK